MEVGQSFNLPCLRNSLEEALSFPVCPSKSLQWLTLKKFKGYSKEMANHNFGMQNWDICNWSQWSLPDKFAIPTHIFARSGGTPAPLKTVEEK